MCLDPLWFYFVNNLILPQKEFADTYLLNAWLALDFMAENGLTRISAKCQQVIKTKISKIQHKYVRDSTESFVKH